MLTQRSLAQYLLGRGAHYLFTGKGNPPTLHDDIRILLDQRIAQRAPDFIAETPKPEHGRRERRSLWTSSALNDYLHFPGVAQVFALRREVEEVKSARQRTETVYGVTRLCPQCASAQRLLTLNRGHWTIEAMHHILDWSFDEDRSRIRTGHGPQNMTRLRRFAIGLIHQRGLGVAQTMRNLARNPRRVLDFLKMTANTLPHTAPGWPPLHAASIAWAPTLYTRGTTAHAPMPHSLGLTTRHDATCRPSTPPSSAARLNTHRPSL